MNGNYIPPYLTGYWPQLNTAHRQQDNFVWSMRCLSIGLATVVNIAVPNQAVAQSATDCKETRRASVEAREFVPERASYQDLRGRIINSALVEAVKQSLGTRVNRIFNSQTLLNNNHVDEKIHELSIDRAKGYVKSYIIINERLEGLGPNKSLIVKIEADVCVPSAKREKEIVAIGEFLLPNGKHWGDAHAVIASKASYTKNLTLATGKSSSVPHDIEVKGRLVSVNIIDVIDQDAEGRQMFGGILRAMAKEMKKDKDAPNFEGFADQMAKGGKKKKITALVLLEGIKKTDNETIYESDEQSVVIPFDQNPQSVMPELVRTAVTNAAARLFAKLDGSGAGSSGGLDVIPTVIPAERGR